MHRINRFADGEVQPPQLFMAPLLDRGIGTLHGDGADDRDIRRMFSEYIGPELIDSESLRFGDLSEDRTPSMEVLVDRYEDITGGLHPGKPTVIYRDIGTDEKLQDGMRLPAEELVAASLARFYRFTKLRPHDNGVTPLSEGAFYIAGIDKPIACLIMSNEDPHMKFFLHELGHCCMPWIGYVRDSTTNIDRDTGAFDVDADWRRTTNGLTYIAEDSLKGTILEEAVAEGLGSLVNKRMGLVRTQDGEESSTLPEMVAPYVTDTSCSAAAPSAVALELIAQELDIPSDRYFRMWVEYANAGVTNPDARQEMAETIYRGTRGRITLGQVEELPYPVNRAASLALLWAVEDSLDVPDHQRYADLFP